MFQVPTSIPMTFLVIYSRHMPFRNLDSDYAKSLKIFEFNFDDLILAITNDFIFC